MKLRIKYGVGKWVMWGYKGRMIYPFLLFSQARDDVEDWLFRHEMQHVYQLRRLGWWRFHAQYLWSLIRVGYDKNQFEVEAVASQHDTLTFEERKLKYATK